MDAAAAWLSLRGDSASDRTRGLESWTFRMVEWWPGRGLRGLGGIRNGYRMPLILGRRTLRDSVNPFILLLFVVLFPFPLSFDGRGGASFSIRGGGKTSDK